MAFQSYWGSLIFVTIESAWRPMETMVLYCAVSGIQQLKGRLSSRIPLSIIKRLYLEWMKLDSVTIRQWRLVDPNSGRFDTMPASGWTDRWTDREHTTPK